LSADELQTLLTHIENRFGKIQSLITDFIQEKHLSIFTEVVKSRGVLMYQHPARIRFEFTEPFQSVFIVNDRSTATFEFVNKKWRKQNTGNARMTRMITEQILVWLQGRFREKDDVYDISAITNGRTRLILTPKHKAFRKHIQSIELGLNVDNTGLTDIILRESGNDYTLISFINERRNPEITKDAFATDNPVFQTQNSECKTQKPEPGTLNPKL
jgi:outer membrane lipoprotein-sorting protein